MESCQRYRLSANGSGGTFRNVEDVVSDSSNPYANAEIFPREDDCVTNLVVLHSMSTVSEMNGQSEGRHT
jgi:hypothetical protein